MRKFLIYTIITCLLGTGFCRTAAAETTLWENKVNIDQEMTISSQDHVKVKPGTHINLSGSRGRLNIQGQLSAGGSEDKPVIITIPNMIHGTTPTSFQASTLLRTNKNLKELEIHPYSVETKEIVDELAAFRKQYAFVWAVLMGIQIYLVLNRSTYW